MSLVQESHVPTVALIGLGRVGAEAPAVAAPDGSLVLRNHLDAIQAGGGVISALVDPSSERRKTAQERCEDAEPVHSVADVTELACGIADVITIAAPVDIHSRLLAEALRLGPKAVLLEKPLARDPVESERMFALAAEARTVLYVGFNRRTDPAMRSFAESFDVKRVRAALFRYGNGLTNYGSHAVDHILQWFGPVEAVQSAPCHSKDPDSSCISFRCLMQSGLCVEVLGVPDVGYDMFEAEIYLPDSVVGIRNNGAEKFHWEMREDLYYPGYCGLVPGGKHAPSIPIGGFVEMYRELFKSISEGNLSTILCSAAVAVENQRVLAAAVISAHENGRMVSLAEMEIMARPGETATPIREAAIGGVVNDE